MRIGLGTTYNAGAVKRRDAYGAKQRESLTARATPCSWGLWKSPRPNQSAACLAGRCFVIQRRMEPHNGSLSDTAGLQRTNQMHGSGGRRSPESGKLGGFAGGILLGMNCPPAKPATRPARESPTAWMSACRSNIGNRHARKHLAPKAERAPQVTERSQRYNQVRLFARYRLARHRGRGPYLFVPTETSGLSPPRQAQCSLVSNG